MSQPWSGPEVKSGSAVANHFYSSSYNYLFYGAVPNSWTQYQGTIGGVAVNGDVSATKFRQGTAYIRPILLTNAHGQANNLIQWQGVEWTRSRPWQNPINPFDVNASGSVTSQDILVISNRLNSSGSGPSGARLG